MMSNYETYSPANVKTFEFKDPIHEADVISESMEQLIGESEAGQKFSAIHVNRTFSAEGRTTFVRLNSLFGSTANADQQYIASQYAAAFPDHGYVSVDLPAHGASDKLTKEQRKDITNNGGSLKKVAEAQVEATLDLVPELKDIVVTGEAMGELFATEFAIQAAAKGVKVRQLFGFDPIGLEDRSPIKLAAGYLGRAQKSRSERSKQVDDAGEQELEDAFSKDFLSKVDKYGPTYVASRAGHAGLMAKERTILWLMFKKSPITRSIGMRALDEAMSNMPELKTNLVFAGNSVVGRLTDPVQTKLDVLKKASKDRLQYDVWPYDNQDIGLARHQPRLIKYILDNL